MAQPSSNLCRRILRQVERNGELGLTRALTDPRHSIGQRIEVREYALLFSPFISERFIM